MKFNASKRQLYFKVLIAIFLFAYDKALNLLEKIILPKEKKNNDLSPQPPSAFPTYPVQEDIPLGHFPDGCQGVLYNTHDRPVGLRGDDHPGYQGQVRDLSLGFQGLGQVEVHLISIKVSIVWSGYTMK